MTSARFMLDVRLWAKWIPGVGYRYDVLLTRETIVHQSRDPECDAARALHDRGLRGTFRMIDFVTGRPRMFVDIAKAAKLRTIERDAGGLTVEPYRPMSDGDRTRLRAPTLHQGGVFLDDEVLCAPEGVKHAGGKTAVRPGQMLEDA
jgi:hypothetical protein